jgi:hypothetical protein
MKDSKTEAETRKHIQQVAKYLNLFSCELLKRAIQHDASKLEEPEVSVFEKHTSLLRDSTYGSDEYKQFLKEMKPALDHHYANNRHHPEFHKNGIKNMTLIDLMEMIADFKSASERHANGDVFKSLEINQKRFGYSDELKQILVNTVAELIEIAKKS